MKKQQKTYILLVAVLCVWGLIGYQIYSRMNPDALVLEDTVILNKFKRQAVVEAPIYELRKPYRDPFSGKYPKKKVTKRKAKVVPKREVLPLPKIVFNGAIQNGKKRSYILTINGKQELLKIGETAQKVTLLKVSNTEIKVKFDGRVTVINLPK